VKRLIASLVLLGLSTPSVAARMALDPLNRAHFGASVVDLSDVGISMGLDSRMTRLVYIDVGGFASAPSSSSAELPDSEDIAAYINTRHGIWVAPGFRVPHRYGDGLKWDVFLRGGFGVLWSQDLSDSESYLTNPAGLGGVDLLLRKDSIGARISGKMFAYRALPKAAAIEAWPLSSRGVLSNQIALEAVYQW
jgi:hypothetical protein